MKPLIRRILLISTILVVAGLTLLFRFVLAEEKTPEKEATATVVDENLPKFYEFGAGLCKPCRMMKPIIHELQEKYRGIMHVVNIDTNVKENEIYKEKFNFKYIPTQVIVDKDGNELARHGGFWAFADIEQKLIEIGIVTKEKLAALENPEVEEQETGLAATFFNKLES